MATILLTASPSTLQHSATLKTAMCLMDHMIHEKSILFHRLKESLPMDEVPLPNVLRKNLLTYTESIADKIWFWMSFHSNNIFTRLSLSYPLRYLDHLVWYEDGIIDYFTTAENLLRNSELSEMEKLNIAKVYFFIDYISEKYSHVPKDEVKTWFSPLETFNTLKEIARPVSGYNLLLRIHKKMAEFLNWYFCDNRAAIISFTSPMLSEVEGSSDETLVRTLLLGFLPE